MEFLDKEYLYISDDILHLLEVLENKQDNTYLLPNIVYLCPSITRDKDGTWSLIITYSNFPITKITEI